MNKLVASVLASTLMCGGAFGFLERGAPDRVVARDSLDVLKVMAPHDATVQGYVSNCVSLIGGALRLEDRHGTPEAQVRGSWHSAAGRCLRLASSACESNAAVPRKGCSRILAYGRQ